jgi:ubiquinone/menaquinone biosynthesis C-methylase UbiE
MSEARKQEPQKKGQPSTYFVQNRENRKELQRLIIQDRMITTMMGGPLPEQTEPARFHRVLDVGCGSGGWILEAAQAYPHMSLFGIDVSCRMIEYAREQAAAQGFSDRVEFCVMDALRKLEFPSDFFDLVNLRLGVSWVRKWDWPALLLEMQRITCPGGVVRLTEAEILHKTSNEVYEQGCQMLLSAFFRAGYLFEEESTGLTAHLVPLLKQHRYQQVQEKKYALEFNAGTPEGRSFIEDIRSLTRSLQPFVEKWNGVSVDYAAFLRRLSRETKRDDLQVTWNFLTAWGNKPVVSL